MRAAWRSIWRNRRRTLITVSSIGFGLACAIVFIAIGDGVYDRLTDDAVRMQAGHITVQHRDYQAAPAVDLMVRDTVRLRAKLARIPGVERTKALVTGQALVRSASGAVGVALLGIEPSNESQVSPLARKMVKGRYLADSDGAVAVVGEALAHQLKVRAGQKMVLTVNDTRGELKEELCRIKGIFRVGSDEIDGYVVQVPIGFARRLFRMPPDAASQVGVVLRNPDNQRRVLAQARATAAAGAPVPSPSETGAGAVDPATRLPGTGSGTVVVLPWQEVIPELASYIKQDGASNYVFQFILIFLVLFTIFNTILMSVMERGREFGVMLAIGTPPARLRSQVLVESLYINLIGCAVGMVVGCLVAWHYARAGIDLSSLLGSNEFSISGIAIDPVMRPKLGFRMVRNLSLLVFVATFLLSVYPVWKSAKQRIAEVLR